MAMVVPHTVNDRSCNPVFVNGLSAFMEPAYVDNLVTEGLCLRDNAHESNELGATLLTPLSEYCLNPPSDDLYDVGQTLKATASFCIPSFSLDHQPANAMYCNISKGNRKRRTKRRAVLLIATQLSELQSEDPDKLLIVKKINRLGFDSADILKEHFEQFGPVEKVRLSNAHTKEPGTSHQVRLRPSGIAFVLFKSSEAAAQVLAEGETQTVNGLDVFVRGFERRQADDKSSPMVDDVDETDSTGTPSTRASTRASSWNSCCFDDVEGEECKD
jgi:hypothetical protein